MLDPQAQLLVAQVINNLAKNPRNRSRLYKAELRCKQLLGWQNCKEKQFKETSPASPGSPTFARSPLRSRTESLEEATKKMTFRDSVKQDYVDWLDTLEEEDKKEESKPRRPKKKKRTKKCSPRVSSKWIVKNPMKSPLWPVKEKILSKTLHTGNLESSLFSKANGTVADVPTGSHLHDMNEVIGETVHSSHSPFSTREYRAANLGLNHRMKQPARSLYEAHPIDAAESRWSPRVEDTRVSDSNETIVRMIDEKGKRFVFNKHTYDIDGECFDGSTLTMWKHVPGARLYDGLPQFLLPNGQKVFFYQTGQSRCTFDAPDGGGIRLMQIHGIKDQSKLDDVGLAGSLPVTPNFKFAALWVKRILGARPQPSCPKPIVPSAIKKSNDADALKKVMEMDNELREAGLIVDNLSCSCETSQTLWDKAGFMIDEPIPLMIQSVVAGKKEEIRRRRREREDRIIDTSNRTPYSSNSPRSPPSPTSDDEDSERKPWSFNRSATMARSGAQFGEQKTLWNDDKDTPLAMEFDWRLNEQKRAFRKFCSRFQPVLENVKGLLRENYKIICDVFRFYSSVEPVVGKFTMSRNEFTDFVQDSGIRDETLDSMVNEGQCDTVYIAVAQPFEKPTAEQKVFMEEASKLFSRRRGHSLMRYEFLDAILRLAQAKYLQTKKAPNMSDALRMLLDKNLLRLYNSEVAINRRAFREKRLQTDSVDEAFRENLLFLKRLFQTFAGTARDSEAMGASVEKDDT